MVWDGLGWLNNQWLSSLNSVLVGAGFNGLVSVFTPSYVVRIKGSEKVFFLISSFVVGFKGLRV